MKRPSNLVVAFILLITCSISYQLITPINGICAPIDLPPDVLSNPIVVEIENEFIVLPLNKYLWRKFHTYKDSEYGIFEYVPNNDIGTTHGELITIKYFKGTFAKTTPLEYANILKIILENKVETIQQKASFAVLEASDINALVEWNLKASPDEPDSHTMTRIMKRNKYLLILEYTGKQPINETRRRMWLEKLKRAEVFEKNTNNKLFSGRQADVRLDLFSI